MAYQSLYRRYRSGTFNELVGQNHVVTALKNAVTENRVGHAYLFSGPRGTGKTSTARILGKALNCTDLQAEGEPCCSCESCISFTEGTSYDLQELDAASNNGVEAVRDLISKVALGSPGRTKIYILDEVHMLTAGAENALLKTLEEPPSHVVFILATTEPHKVAPTIRSRTQHYEFELLPADKLEKHVRWIAEDAKLVVSDEMVEYVLRAGGGSARDTLSALEQVVTAGGIPNDDDFLGTILSGIAQSDPSLVVNGLSQAIRSGRDPRIIGESLVDRLRDGFLLALNAPTEHFSEHQKNLANELAGIIKLATLTRSLETIGSALIGMRQSADPRIDLEVALIRLTHPELSTEIGALVERIERLESGIKHPQPTTTPQPDIKEEPAKQKKEKQSENQSVGTSQPVDQVKNEKIENIGIDQQQVEQSWSQAKESLKGLTKALFKELNINVGDDGTIYLVAPNETHRQKCEDRIDEARNALNQHLGQETALKILVSETRPVRKKKPKKETILNDEEIIITNLDELKDAPMESGDEISLINKSFPGAKIVEPDQE
ncbi:MAG: DNA polymerase III subunit gamma/tau [Acidimicrobiales bacterium]|jgi:DNA polymerase III subunit gamma/tau|nr:DNA polymerase III subunit gamma/tau [Acidimicrobiales bacterium]HJM27701.1 DNA polymerase III subunit gamma/tau [Acidimicrobiales bacterium]